MKSEEERVDLALGTLLGTSGWSSEGKPRKPLNLSKVTWETWRTSVGKPISKEEEQTSSLSTLHVTSDFFNAAIRISNMAN